MELVSIDKNGAEPTNGRTLGRRITDTRVDNTGARVVSVLRPLEDRSEHAPVSQPQKEAFKASFFATLNDDIEGGLTPYLFYDPPKVSPELEQEIWGSQGPVNVGASAWDQHILESLDLNEGKRKPVNNYGFASGDVEVINTALDSGLIKRLPAGAISYFGYGVGETLAVTKKDCRLIRGLIEAGKNIAHITAVDLNDRYASKATQVFHEEFNRETQGISGDFMDGVLPISPETENTALVSIFGGPFANAPYTKNSQGISTPKQNAARYLAKITQQHGPGTHVLMTVEIRPKGKNLSSEFIDSVVAQYAPTKSFEAFLLSAFPRAVYDGVIRRPYDVFDNWKMVTDFDRNLNAVKLMAESKKDHTIETELGPYSVSKGDRIVPILSSKWDEDEVQAIFNVAGSSYFKMYGTGSRRLVHAVMGHANTLEV